MGNDLLIPFESDYSRIGKMAIEHLKNVKEFDLRVFIESECGIYRAESDLVSRTANELRKVKGLILKPHGIGDTNTFIISKKSWSERNPVWDKVRTGFITALFSLIVGAILFQIQNRGKVQLDSQQDLRLKHLSDSLKILEKHLRDSVKVVSNSKPNWP